VRNFIGKKNEAKVFVGTNDEDLRNDLRNLGTVPIFFFKHSMLVMDAPTEVTEEKHRMVRLVLLLTFFVKREQLKIEPTIQEKAFLKEQREQIEEYQRQERHKEAMKRRE
jgi:hypothetical protein